MSKVDLIKSPIIQSPYTILQAAGSDGRDSTVAGMHLRWDFLKMLGDNHLAKGDYTTQTPYASTLGFNRPSDYIKIYRTDFKQQYYTVIDFQVAQTTEVKTGNTRAWKYALPVNGLTGVTTNVTVRFIDYTQYDQIRAAQTTFKTLDLLNAYTGIVEVETDNKLSFYAEIFWAATNSASVASMGRDQGSGQGNPPPTPNYLRVESVTIPDTSDFSTKQVSCRKKFTNNRAGIISCDNIQYLRFDYILAKWNQIRIYCYEDQIAGTNSEKGTNGGWDLVGNFALTTDDTVRDTRFIPVKVDGTGGHWPKFNDDNAITGEFTVNKQNYFDRWRRAGFTFNDTNETNNDKNGLQHFVHTYMKLSKTDERALAAIPSDDVNDPSTQDISYVDMLKLVSLDFHVARILGLGHIDDKVASQNQSTGNSQLEVSSATPGGGRGGPFIYCLEYKTFVKLEAPYTTNAERTHIFMTSLVSQSDYHLPATPVLLPLSFGISVDNGTSTPTLLTDPQGYAPFGNLRFINVNRGPFNYEKPFGPFYVDPTEFCLCDETQAIAYGLEYKEVSESIYRKPEISHDSVFLDRAGIPETVPILEGGTPTIFTHQETEEGTHEYKAYAINWFSRVSPLSNPVTAATTFPKQTTLLPPFNLAVQLIQDEDPAETNIPDKTLVLTTQAEQQLLAAIPNTQDNTLVRTSFDWNHVHHNSHQYADYADLFFRRSEPQVVKGKIISIIPLPNNRAQVNTTSYQITSTFPATTVQPSIAASDTNKFAGSFFSSGQDNYVIESVIANGANPTFIIKQIKQVNAAAPNSNNQNQFISNETFKSPTNGDLFFATENMAALSNWDLRHSKRVYLEKFYTNAKVKLRFSPTRATVFDIKAVSFASGNTTIDVVKPLNTGLLSGLTIEYSVKSKITAVATSKFSIAGNQTADFTSGVSFRVFANKDNDGLYTVNSSTFTGGNTVITVNETIPNIANTNGLVELVVSRLVTGINTTTNSIIIAGNKLAEINLAYLEYKTETDGTVTRFVTGGINDTVNFVPLLNAQNNGSGFVQLNFQNFDLLPHPDPEISWYKGTVRLKDVSGVTQVYPITFIGNLTTGTPPHLSVILQDPGFVPKDEPTNTTNADIYTIDLNTPQSVNYHPSYKFYLKTDNGLNPTTGLPVAPNTTNFDTSEILPVFSDPNEGNRQTYMAIRAFDAKNDLESFLSSPVVLLAQKISVPVAPGKPAGPLYATRPDFFGKSTYTFDTKLDTTGGRIPYSAVFYRASEDRLLDILYKKTTQDTIWNNLNALTDPKAKFDPLLWDVLFSGQNTGANFATYTTTAGSFTWPLPDNDEFYLPYISNKDLGLTNPPPSGYYVFPFKNTFNFKLNQNFTVYGKPMSGKDILKKAIQDAFIPLNEQPPMFSYIKTGKQTSGVKAKVRDAFGNLLDPIANDIFPMIKKYIFGTDTFVRYTDYTLDGASKSLYFYRAVEMDDKFKFSDASLPVGPVLMVNAFAPNKPQIKKLFTQLRNGATRTRTSILFDLNAYLENEKISKIEIYRALNEDDALSIRTMKKAKSINWGDPVIDDFSDVAFPLYGETLFYRVIAIREIEDVEDILLAPPQNIGDPIPTLITDLPSLPSESSKISIVDINNPSAPQIYYTSDPPTVTTPITLNNVVLNWPTTCHNGTYYLYKMTDAGNWVKIYQIKSNAPIISISLASTDLLNGSLVKQDSNLGALYYRFRVVVENSSGLSNLTQNELTI